jgi:hypothetical protein
VLTLPLGFDMEPGPDWRKNFRIPPVWFSFDGRFLYFHSLRPTALAAAAAGAAAADAKSDGKAESKAGAGAAGAAGEAKSDAKQDAKAGAAAAGGVADAKDGDAKEAKEAKVTSRAKTVFTSGLMLATLDLETMQVAYSPLPAASAAGDGDDAAPAAATGGAGSARGTPPALLLFSALLPSWLSALPALARALPPQAA